MVITEELKLYRPPALPADQVPQSWRLPADVRVENDHIVFEMSDHATPSGDTGMLEGFLALAEAPPDKIADYAHEWGVLGLCKHDWPMHWSHTKLPCSGPWTKREPVSVWRGMSRAFGALLEIAGRIEQGAPSDEPQTRAIQFFNSSWNDRRRRMVDWSYGRADEIAQDQHPDTEYSEADLRRAQLGWDRWDFTDAIGHLLRNSVQVTVSYPTPSSRRPVMSYAARSLVDALALQSAMATCQAESVIACDGCGVAFVPSARYRPRAGQRRFCDSCRTSGVPQKLADRDRRARMREQTVNRKGK